MAKQARNLMRPESELYPRHEFGDNAVEGRAVCKKCHAVHQHKHWSFDDALASELLEQPDGQQVVCPGCRAVETRKADGLLSLRGTWVRRHHVELENLLRAQEKRAMEKNPLSRIIYIESHADAMEVATTTEFLARDLGRRVHKAHGGDLVVDKLPREAFTRVRWVAAPQEG